MKILEHLVGYQGPVEFVGASHRSGWRYCLELLGSFQEKESIILVDYVERVFGWNCSKDCSPLTEKWIGFLHHPLDQGDPYCLLNLVKKQIFSSSLTVCQGLIVFSFQLKKMVERLLPHIPVHHLYHPVEKIGYPWSEEAFRKGKKRLIFLGSWKRNHSLFFSLRDADYLKTWLPGDFQSLKQVPFPLDLRQNLREKYSSSLNSSENSKEVLRDGSSFEDLGKKGIEIAKVSHEVFDTWLKESVVLLLLQDTVINNAFLDCLVRDTPIICNRHPVLINEILGSDYPYWADTEEEIYLCWRKIVSGEGLNEMREVYERLRPYYTGENFLSGMKKILS